MTEISDYELIMLYHENNEEATKLLFEKYNLLIKRIINKYDNILKKLGIDKRSLYSDSLRTFNMALNQYNNLTSASFYTYVTLLVERLIKKKIVKYNRPKYKFLQNIVSLDAEDESFLPLMDRIEIDSSDPLERLLDEEEQKSLQDAVKNTLSTYEYYIYKLFLKGLTIKEITSITKDNNKKIINALQRIKKKLKEIKNVAYFS